MTKTTDFIAVDLGASNGRVLLGRWDGKKFALEELHRFPNNPVCVRGRQYWKILQLWSDIRAGLGRCSSQPAGIGVDTWGVDYGLLDKAGNLMGNPVQYRDSRCDGMPEQAFKVVPRKEIFDTTGIQFMQINTIFQLYSQVLAKDPQLETAETMLMMPDLFHYWLSGRKAGEYTIASTSQLLDCKERRWATGLVKKLGIPDRFLPEIIPPGTALGPILPDVAGETGLPKSTPVIATGSHDTASAVAAIPGLDEKSAYISSGTWSLMGVEIAQPIVNDQALALNFTNEGGVAGTIRLLKNVMGLWLLQECRRIWQKEGKDYDWQQMLAEAQKAKPFRSLIDPDRSDFLNPEDMPAAIRAFCRKSGQPEPGGVGEVIRCCLESLALKYRWVMEALEKLTGRKLETIRIAGGGSQNRMLSQFTADACRRPVVTGPVEVTTLGNVLMQAIATGHLKDIASGREAIAASVDQERLEPGPEGPWQEAYARFTKLLS